MQGNLEGKITLEVNKTTKEVSVVAKSGHRIVDKITLEDDYYLEDTVSFLKELMGQCIQHIARLSTTTEMIELVEDELDNWGNYTITKED